MNPNPCPAKPARVPSRRDFLSASAAAAVGAALASGPQVARSAHAAEDNTLRVGLIGCGGRGTGAASQALRADKNVKLTALGDVFEDRLKLSLNSLSQDEEISAKIDVPPDRRFIGFDAFQKVIDSGVDVVLLATPPHFRPQHLEAAVAAGKHIFAEKPVAVDAPGVRRVLAACKTAEEKSLSVVSGLCLRYSLGFQEIVKRIHDGEIGDVHTLQANDYRGGIWHKGRESDWTDMHWQMRNWYYFCWLSGDFNVEQHVHFLDVCAWVKGEYPESAVGMGGREVRTDPMYGDIFDHHGVVYEFQDGAKLFSNTRQMKGCFGDMSAQAAGSKGRANINERIKAGGVHLVRQGETWVYRGEDNPIYQTEHDRLFESIRRGEPINNGEYMAKSTLLAILGRMATYTGQKITWDQALNSNVILGPQEYKWGPAPPVEPPQPGLTKGHV